MSAGDFWQMHVEPAIAAWTAAPADQHLAMHLAGNLNHMADYYWAEFRRSDPNKVFGAESLKAFRQYLAERCPSYGLVRDIADAHKHKKISRKDRAVTSAGQTTPIRFGWGELECGLGEYGSPPQLIVTLDDGKRHRFRMLVQDTVAMWRDMIGEK